MNNAFSLFATALRAIVDALCYCGLEFINLAAFGTDACVGRHNLCAEGIRLSGDNRLPAIGVR